MIRIAVIVSLVACVSSGRAVAQSAPEPTVADSIDLFGPRDWALVGGLVAAQVALLPVDENVRRATGRMRTDATDAFADVLRPLGRLDALQAGAVATYALGKLIERRSLADIGLHAFVSLTLANAVTGTVKGFAGRARPWILETQGTDSVWVSHGPGEWDAFAGWTEGGSRQAYPSGHTTNAFVIATVLAEEFGGAVPWVAYPVAAGVAWSRLHDEAHWASDVVMGALVGIVSGRLVVRHGHRPGGWLEGALLFEPAPRGGVVVGLRVPTGNGGGP